MLQSMLDMHGEVTEVLAKHAPGELRRVANLYISLLKELMEFLKVH